MADPRTYLRMTGAREGRGYQVGFVGQGVRVEGVWLRVAELPCDVTVAIVDIDSVEVEAKGLSRTVKLRDGKVIDLDLKEGHPFVQLIVPSPLGHLHWDPIRIARERESALARITKVE